MKARSFSTGGITAAAALVLLAAVSFVANLQAAAPLGGQVAAVHGTNIEIIVASKGAIEPGDRVELLYTTSTGVELPVGIWRVRTVSGTTVTAEMADSATRPVVGLRAKIYPGSKVDEKTTQAPMPSVASPERPQTSSLPPPAATGWLGVAIVADQKGGPDGDSDMLSRFFGANPGAGVAVAEVAAGGPADRAGLNVQDLIIELNGQPAGKAADFARSIGDLGEGATAKLTIIRQGKRLVIPVILERAPGH
ncbi:MAG TPA: PDZ domain-containing protein [Syntrophorhabdaceae bacterium]|nr:PDZ domain-containing protein [Syntrophorhabdaceae bacterium]